MFSLLILAALCAFPINATPVSVNLIHTRNAPEDTGIFVCRDIGWQVCEHVLSKWGNSTSDAYCLQLDGQTSAVGPDPGLECVLYSSIDCKGTENVKMRYPGLPWLGAEDFNDKAKSFQCYWMDDPLATVGSSSSLGASPTDDEGYGGN